MKNLSLLVLVMFCFSVFAFAQSSPVASPAASAVASAAQPAVVAVVAAPSAPAAPVSAGLIGILIAVVLGLNAVLSSLQKIFGAMAQSEPGWLQSLSSIVLAVAKFLGSNPDTPPTKPNP